MHRPNGVGNAQYLDRALNLPPVAEVDDIAERAAAVGALGGFQHRMIAEQRHQLMRQIQARAIDMNMIVQEAAPFSCPMFRPGAVSNMRMLTINGMFTTHSWRTSRQAAMGTGMDKSGRKGTRAGGFILAVCIMAGAVIGGLMGQPSAGLLAGGSLGALVALAMWLRDRRYTG